MKVPLLLEAAASIGSGYPGGLTLSRLSLTGHPVRLEDFIGGGGDNSNTGGDYIDYGDT